MTSSVIPNSTFEQLVSSLHNIHTTLSKHASKAVNISLTLRNWLIGYHIREYEQNGADRAQYGEGLLDNLAAQLKRGGMKRVASRELRRYRQFYLVYPQIWEAMTPELRNLLPDNPLVPSEPIRESATPKFQLPSKSLVTKLSFTKLAELITIDDTTKRAFYEFECIRGNWSVRELKRQISSLYYERYG